MKTCLIVMAAVVFMAAGGMVAHDRWRYSSVRSHAERIRVGESKLNVEHLLGSPTAVFRASERRPTTIGEALVYRSSETWAYGSSFDFRNSFSSEFPYFNPIRLRLFGPHSDDVALEFDSSERVSAVSIPEFAP
jgi:hypothetical protein